MKVRAIGLVGGRRPGYLVLRPLRSIADYPESGPDPISALLSALVAERASSNAFPIETELWRYRPTLSLVR